MFFGGRGSACACCRRWPSARSACRWRRGRGAAAVSGLEVCIGLACREVLHIAVWDYSAEWGNLAGLVCPRYCLYWFLLCGWVILVLRVARRFTVRPVYRT